MSVLRNKRDETRKANAAQEHARRNFDKLNAGMLAGQAETAPYDDLRNGPPEIGYGLSPVERQLLNEGSAGEILDEYQWRLSNNRRHDSFVQQCSEYLYKVVGKDKQ